jgi:2-amino-4-hydroxy-6-hydroxymethyldihydropteridine diphosphokinase
VARVYLSLGSNLGDREGNLRAALDRLGSAVTVDAVSSLWNTSPVGVADQPDFLNLAVAASTVIPPQDLLAVVKDIEGSVGRKPTYRWGPRIVDIDILLYDDLVVSEPDLTIPHPEMRNRYFVLAPLSEIAPNVLHPVLRLTVAEMLAQAPGRNTVNRWHTDS